MAIEIKAPTFPESVQEGTVATWHKNVGDSVTRDELIVDIETDKVVLEVVAPATGTLTEVLKGEDDLVQSNEVIARIEEGEATQPAAAPAAKKPEPDVQVADALVIRRPKSLPMSAVLIYHRSLAPAKVAELPKKMWSTSPQLQHQRLLLAQRPPQQAL